MFETVAEARRPRGLVPPIDPSSIEATDPAAAERIDRIRRILDAAVALADEGGFEAVRARELCDRANVSMGTLYRCYESKEEILLHAFSDAYERWSVTSRPVRSRARPRSTASTPTSGSRPRRSPRARTTRAPSSRR